MITKLMDKITQENLEKGPKTDCRVGDKVKVHVRIKEGDKERVQVFPGTVIARGGRGSDESFTVRRVSHGVGVERVFPLASPFVAKVEVDASASVRRAKLYYIRKLSGKKARLKETARK